MVFAGQLKILKVEDCFVWQVMIYNLSLIILNSALFSFPINATLTKWRNKRDCLDNNGETCHQIKSIASHESRFGLTNRVGPQKKRVGQGSFENSHYIMHAMPLLAAWGVKEETKPQKRALYWTSKLISISISQQGNQSLLFQIRLLN